MDLHDEATERLSLPPDLSPKNSHSKISYNFFDYEFETYSLDNLDLKIEEDTFKFIFFYQKLKEKSFLSSREKALCLAMQDMISKRGEDLINNGNFLENLSKNFLYPPSLNQLHRFLTPFLKEPLQTVSFEGSQAQLKIPRIYLNTILDHSPPFIFKNSEYLPLYLYVQYLKHGYSPLHRLNEKNIKDFFDFCSYISDKSFVVSIIETLSRKYPDECTQFAIDSGIATRNGTIQYLSSHFSIKKPKYFLFSRGRDPRK